MSRNEEESVALRKESVDRNIIHTSNLPPFRASLSARRVWIEIDTLSALTPKQNVALRKESVDRNY